MLQIIRYVNLSFHKSSIKYGSLGTECNRIEVPSFKKHFATPRTYSASSPDWTAGVALTSTPQIWCSLDAFTLLGFQTVLACGSFSVLQTPGLGGGWIKRGSNPGSSSRGGLPAPRTHHFHTRASQRCVSGDGQAGLSRSQRSAQLAAWYCSSGV